MEQFQRGEIKILVATTVIEVGVDVPNATVMVIEQAERFRARAIASACADACGARRGARSYCILVTEKLNVQARERIRTLVESNDGFHIAEMDMKLRGPGEFFGTRQSGLPSLQIGNILRDADVLEIARRRGRPVRDASAVGGRLAPRRDAYPRTLAAAVWAGAGGMSAQASVRCARLKGSSG